MKTKKTMEEKKKVIVTLCKSFPATHQRAGELTNFEDKIGRGVKIHTIRYNGKNVWDQRYKDIKAGRKYLSVREWTGRPYNSEQREFARYDRIGLQKITIVKSFVHPEPQIWIDDKHVPAQVVANNDGLSVEDFTNWFFGKGEDNVFEGVIIHFTDFRY